MTVKIETIAVGEARQHPLCLPETLSIRVTRDDGYAPSEMEIYSAFEIALEGMRTKWKEKKKQRKGLQKGK